MRKQQIAGSFARPRMHSAIRRLGRHFPVDAAHVDHPGLPGPDDDFDAAIDLLLLYGSRCGRDESRFAESPGGDPVGRDIHHRDEPGLHGVRTPLAEIEVVIVGAEGIAYVPR